MSTVEILLIGIGLSMDAFAVAVCKGLSMDRITLKKAGIVRSVRGAGGGYVLVKRLEDISVGDVLRALEGSLEPVDCAGLEPNGGCSVSDSCVTKYVWKKINDSINQTVDEIKLDQLVKENGKNCRN